MTSHLSAVTPQEFAAGAIVRLPRNKRALECAALEEDGTLNVWNERGDTIEITGEDRDATVALLLKGKLRPHHLSILLEATGTKEIQSRIRDGLTDLYRHISRYCPPTGLSSNSASLTARFAPASILWTVSKEMRITSITGSGATYLGFEGKDKIEGMAIQTFCGEESVADPFYNAHLLAFAGSGTSFIRRRNGAEWRVQIQPVLDAAFRVVGLVGYAGITPEEPIVENEALGVFIITDTQHKILVVRGNFEALLGVHLSEPEGLSLLDVVQRTIPQVEDATDALKRFTQVADSVNPESQILRLRNGRVIYRVMQPIRNDIGTVVARTWMLYEHRLAAGVREKPQEQPKALRRMA
jgi:PAS domain-containing protein